MGEELAFVTEDINLPVDKAVPESTKKSTSYAVNVFDGKLFVNFSSKLWPGFWHKFQILKLVRRFSSAFNQVSLCSTVLELKMWQKHIFEEKFLPISF